VGKLRRTNPRHLLAVTACLVLAVLLVRSVRATLFEQHREVTNEHDVYFLPPPEQVEAMSLGYKAAVADVLWAHVLVSQGLHTFERRRFENLTRLYDTINSLAPTWRTPYLLADALITFQSAHTPLEEVIKAREILERGIEHRPYDSEIWLNLGQFVSFVAPASYIEDHDPELAKRWRSEGTAYLARAAELGANDSNISWQALGGANILLKAGERDAAIRFLKRTYAVTDDEELKKDILRRLERLVAEREFDRYRTRDEAFRRRYESELPFLTRDQALVLGPPPEPARCAGGGNDASCATSWREWSERFEAGGNVGDQSADE
jgi:tetratricopeptide (TPR) repeat protein